MMYATISRWGNSQGIRIPKAVLDALGLGENDRVELGYADDAITIRKAAAPKHRTLEERLTSFYGKPLDQIAPLQSEELDWGAQEGTEAW